MTNTRCCSAANTTITLHICRLSICSTSSMLTTMNTLRWHVAACTVALRRMAMVSLFMSNLLLLLLLLLGCIRWELRLTASPIIHRRLLVLLLLFRARCRLRACTWLRRVLRVPCSLCCVVDLLLSYHLLLLLLGYRFDCRRCCRLLIVPTRWLSLRGGGR